MTIKLNEIKRMILPWPFPVNTPRKYVSVINRLRIGHTLIFNEERRFPHLLTPWDPSHIRTHSHRMQSLYHREKNASNT